MYPNEAAVGTGAGCVYKQGEQKIPWKPRSKGKVNRCAQSFLPCAVYVGVCNVACVLCVVVCLGMQQDP